MWRFIVELYPITWLLWKLGIGLAPVVSQALDEEPRINPNPKWAVAVAERLTACENRGLAKLYLRVVDEGAEPLEGVVVTFGWESGRQSPAPKFYEGVDPGAGAGGSCRW